jgi:hypothetical protein
VPVTFHSVKSSPLHGKDYEFTYNGYDFKRVAVSGLMNSGNIYAACLRHGLRPVCDYPSYSNGKCRLVQNSNFYFSYPGHSKAHTSIDEKNLLGAYFYRGSSDTYTSHLNQGHTHRGSNTNDRDGDTYCVSKTGETPKSFVYNRHTMFRVPVSGQMTDTNCLTACIKFGAKPVCDQNSYHDGQCASLGGPDNFHFSHGEWAASVVSVYTVFEIHTMFDLL